MIIAKVQFGRWALGVFFSFVLIKGQTASGFYLGPTHISDLERGSALIAVAKVATIQKDHVVTLEIRQIIKGKIDSSEIYLKLREIRPGTWNNLDEGLLGVWFLKKFPSWNSVNSTTPQPKSQLWQLAGYGGIGLMPVRVKGGRVIVDSPGVSIPDSLGQQHIDLQKLIDYLKND